MMRQKKTVDRIITAATGCFATQSYGASSLSGIALEAGTSKQVVLHHFGTKERLYLAVLAVLQEQLDDWVQAARRSVKDPLARLEKLLLFLFDPANQQTVELTVRALLEVASSETTAERWPLMPFVEQLRDLAKEVADQQNKCPDQVFSTVYAMVGSVSYYRLSAGALVAMFGPETYGDMEARFKVDLRHRLEEVQ
jgi:AcrR family transcriptional regulator